jgi:predicted ArsR family transcriptional regulator
MEISNASSQDKILYQIKRLGPQSVKSLAEILDVTTMGVRQHLAQLESAGLIESLPEQPQPRGRPLKTWKLTQKGHGRFPDAHAQITADLILSVRELLGESAMDKIIEKRTADTFKQYSACLDKQNTLSGKVSALARLRSDEGYMAEVTEENSEYLLLEHHCPICIAAKSCQGFCRSELEVFQKLFEKIASVTREDHLLDTARRCSYRIIPIVDAN